MVQLSASTAVQAQPPRPSQGKAARAKPCPAEQRAPARSPPAAPPLRPPFSAPARSQPAAPPTEEAFAAGAGTCARGDGEWESKRSGLGWRAWRETGGDEGKGKWGGEEGREDGSAGSRRQEGDGPGGYQRNWPGPRITPWSAENVYDPVLTGQGRRAARQKHVQWLSHLRHLCLQQFKKSFPVQFRTASGLRRFIPSLLGPVSLTPEETNRFHPAF